LAERQLDVISISRRRLIKLNDREIPATPACRAALDVATAYCSPALLNHSVRAYLCAAGYALERGIAFDAELLYVSAAFEDQATRKPRCLAAQFVRSGLAARLAANPLER
jgi:hypothetical protein